MRWKEIQEAHHAYDEPSHATKFQPLKAGDTVRVFHGFRDKPDAIDACLHGLSGKERANRVYSYEFDNNPKGLFVTLSFKVAGEFGGTIIEFVADSGDLEAPVWPGGSYTVQGQMAQYFGHGAKGRANRNKRRRDARAETEKDFAGRPDPEYWQHVTNSDDMLTANMLLNSREYQALFVGDLHPKQIVAVYTRDQNSYDSPYTRHTVEEFIQGNPADPKRHSPKGDRLFSPNEPFNGDAFIQRINERFGGRNDRDMEPTLKGLWAEVVKSKERVRTFMSYFENFLWPKQYTDAIRWMKSRWGNGEG
ncbi:MAG: hypothetical protein EOO77_20575 [Oxalobacteraceae bacterium]|nr:MAG: hypothetical protein EOO77_20575 [Oxalobacteraceae bacterium]